MHSSSCWSRQTRWKCGEKCWITQTHKIKSKLLNLNQIQGQSNLLNTSIDFARQSFLESIATSNKSLKSNLQGMHTKHFIIKINSKCDHGLIGFCNLWFATNATSKATIASQWTYPTNIKYATRKVTITFQQTLSTIAIYGLHQHTRQGYYNLSRDFQQVWLGSPATQQQVHNRTPAGFANTILVSQLHNSKLTKNS